MGLALTGSNGRLLWNASQSRRGNIELIGPWKMQPIVDFQFLNNEYELDSFRQIIGNWGQLTKAKKVNMNK